MRLRKWLRSARQYFEDHRDNFYCNRHSKGSLKGVYVGEKHDWVCIWKVATGFSGEDGLGEQSEDLQLPWQQMLSVEHSVMVEVERSISGWLGNVGQVTSP